ncbi:MAG: glutathione S-transferase family protein [Alphaproteobacteria bacterium]|nr:glutathione S-transferase family protein [Alphaproteobacteria bacterium]
MTQERKHCTLYHYPLCPFSRTVRLCLYEKNISYVLVFEKPWERRMDFMRLNPAGTVPVFEDEDETVLSDYRSICEYLNETRVGLELFGDNPKSRAEVRRLLGWFDSLFYPEVYQNLVVQKALKKMQNRGEPNATAIRIGRQNLKRHLDYLEWLCERRSWLAGESLSIADLNAAAHLSVLDYLGEINWDLYPETKEWYAKIKSRPSFQYLLTDRLPGIIPPDAYSNLDF